MAEDLAINGGVARVTTLLLALLFTSPAVVAAELKPFVSDGCSSFPDGTISHQSLWVSCCIRHDLSYWKGGTYEERLKVDRALEQCVAKVGKPKVAKLMLAGVRVGGSPYFPTNYRWGYGWPYLRGYKALSEPEKGEVSSKLEMLGVMIKSISQELEVSRSSEEK
ncbi:MAG: FAD-binding oxidoreductase [Candidatus Sedimenticola sp. (ex Thyasira tokunagai)]